MPQIKNISKFRSMDINRYQDLIEIGIVNFKKITKLAAHHCGTPIALIFMNYPQYHCCVSMVGVEKSEVTKFSAIFDKIIKSPESCVLEDISSHALFKNIEIAIAELSIKFYAGAPIVSPDGFVIGTLCVVDYLPKKFSDQQLEDLSILAAEIMNLLELEKHHSDLQSTIEELEQKKFEQTKIQFELQSSLALLENLTRHAPGVLYQYKLYPDGSSSFPYASAGILDIYELRSEEVLLDATEVFRRIHPEDLQIVKDTIAYSASNLTPWECEYRVCLPIQGVRWRRGVSNPEKLKDGSILWHGFIVDITDQKKAEDKIIRLALFDQLTGLPNRHLLLDNAKKAILSAQFNGNFGALIFLDLDNFKETNDSQGHAVGDILLSGVAKNLIKSVRVEDVIARIGGDEFVILLSNLGQNLEDAKRTAKNIAKDFCKIAAQPIEFGDTSLHCTASLGIALFPRRDNTVHDFLREADIAMYRAKAAGRNRAVLFEISMQNDLNNRLTLIKDLQKAIINNELESYVQSQVDREGKVIGGELLLRWSHPISGFISPEVFIPLAEECGLIGKIGEKVILDACKALKTLNDANAENLTISINVSPKQLREECFVPQVNAILEESGAPGHLLIIEVTEGLIIENIDLTLDRMSELKKNGIRFSIDDFGTGYSNLSYIKSMPVSELKIDKKFVLDIPHDKNDIAIVKSIIAMAKYLNLKVVAEGIENEGQAKFMCSVGCQILQGYLFCKPIPITDWLDCMCKKK